MYVIVYDKAAYNQITLKGRWARSKSGRKIGIISITLTNVFGGVILGSMLEGVMEPKFVDIIYEGLMAWW